MVWTDLVEDNDRWLVLGNSFIHSLVFSP